MSAHTHGMHCFFAEILLGCTRYTTGVDIWAVGCILGEMLYGRPIFPGASAMNQIERVVEVTGIPSLADINSINSPFTATMLESLPQIAQKKLRDIFPDATPDAMDFLQKCFYFNPDLRPSAEQLLAHPLCADFHNAEEEPIYPYGPIRLPIDDNTKLTAAQYRDRLYQEITDRRKETRRKEQVRAKASVGSSMVTGGASPAVGGGYTTGSAVGGGGGGTNSIIG